MGNTVHKILRFGYSRVWHRWPVMIVPLMRRFHRFNKYWPHPFTPRSFNEKTLWRMLFDRRSIYAQVAGKFEARDFVRRRLGTDENLIPLIALIRDPFEVRHLELPGAFILKINDGSQLRRIWRVGEAVDRDEMERLVAEWLAHQQAKWQREWVYTQVAHAVIAEHFIGSDAGVPPDDLKFNCHDGRVHSIVHVRRGGPAPLVNHYDRDWNCLPIKASTGPMVDPAPRLVELDEAIRIAEAVSAGFDYLRVDLFVVAGRIWLGELTTLHSAGILLLDPPEWDFTFGQPWALPNGVDPISALLGGQPDVTA